MLEGIKEKITRLISLYETECRRSDELSLRLEKSESALGECRKQITELERQIDNLKLSGAFLQTGGNAAARERLDKLIGEIDRCIKLLEK